MCETGKYYGVHSLLVARHALAPLAGRCERCEQCAVTAHILVLYLWRRALGDYRTLQQQAVHHAGFLVTWYMPQGDHARSQTCPGRRCQGLPGCARETSDAV